MRVQSGALERETCHSTGLGPKIPGSSRDSTPKGRTAGTAEVNEVLQQLIGDY